MKNLLIIFLFGAMLVWSCVPEDDAFFATSTSDAASVTAPANVAFVKDVSTGADIAIGLLGKSEASDIASVKLFARFVPSDVTPDPEEDGTEILEITTYPKSISITEEQLLSLAGLTSVGDLNPGDRWIIKYKINLTNGTTLTGAVKTNISFTCQSDLGGDIDFVTTDITAGAGGDAGACGGSTSGTVTFDDQGGGIYNISDITFGQYDCAWGDNPATGVSLVDVCGKLSLIGTDQYELVYSISIISNDGTELVIHWENDYGDSGTTTLTRTDDKDWPLDLSTE